MKRFFFIIAAVLFIAPALPAAFAGANDSTITADSITTIDYEKPPEPPMVNVEIDEFPDEMPESASLQIGAGFLRVFDRDVLNNPDKVRLNPAWNLYGSFEVSENGILAGGLYGELHGQVFKGIEYRNDENRYVIDDLPYLNAIFGIFGKMYLRQTAIRPFLTGVIGVQNGLLFFTDYLKYNKGLILGGGAGLAAELFGKIKISAEYRFHLGFSFWDDPPVYNSGSSYFNPNYAYGLITFGWRVK